MSELDERTLALLKGALAAHPEFLDIWRELETGKPEAYVELTDSVAWPSGVASEESM